MKYNEFEDEMVKELMRMNPEAEVVLEQLDQDGGMEQELADFEKVREHLTIRMVNQEKNRKLLEDVVSIPFLNLSGIFYVADSLESMMLGVKVTRFLAELWGVGMETLRETALENLASSGAFQMREISEVLSEFPEYRIRRGERGKIGLYVVTDASRTNGPAVLLLPEILDRMAEELGDDLLILPSSVHELMVLKAADAYIGDLLRIVREINASVVSAGEFLADCVYQYSRERSEVTMVA